MSGLKTIAQVLLRHSFIRFGIIGACGYVVGATVLALTTGPLKLDFAAGNALAIFIAMTFTWQGNRHFTFSDRHTSNFPGECATASVARLTLTYALVQQCQLP